ncbi:Golgi-associated plant pathoproteinsis- protein 1 [Bulinus truncatus]|nr:Golgi-associated plant pathoproteinsis- protein 1 [Bulinus truncatus]
MKSVVNLETKKSQYTVFVNGVDAGRQFTQTVVTSPSRKLVTYRAEISSAGDVVKRFHLETSDTPMSYQLPHHQVISKNGLITVKAAEKVKPAGNINSRDVYQNGKSLSPPIHITTKLVQPHSSKAPAEQDWRYSKTEAARPRDYAPTGCATGRCFQGAQNDDSCTSLSCRLTAPDDDRPPAPSSAHPPGVHHDNPGHGRRDHHAGRSSAVEHSPHAERRPGPNRAYTQTRVDGGFPNKLAATTSAYHGEHHNAQHAVHHQDHHQQQQHQHGHHADHHQHDRQHLRHHDPRTTVLDSLRHEALRVHNERRAQHGIAPLRLSSDLNEYAQHYAEHLARTGKFEHSSCILHGQRIGENLAYRWSSNHADYSVKDAVDGWYREINDYDFSREENSLSKTGHFTQLIWRETQELGVGKAHDQKGQYFIVASYRPAGNLIDTKIHERLL